MAEDAARFPAAPATSVEALISRVRGQPAAMANLARSFLLARGLDAQARELCREALKLAPEDEEVRLLTAEVLTHEVGGWYFTMVRDEARHRAYRDALGRALARGGRVLDVGSGTGLFAMMAAQAGADEVISCERRPAVAEAAAKVVAQNGFADRIRVLAKPSQEVQIGLDMAGRADVLVWDNLTSDMLGAGALESIEDATRRLLRPGAQVIPGRCEIKAALAQDGERWRRTTRSAAGFDLSAFAQLAKPSYELEAASSALVVRSTEATLFDFDLQLGGPFPPEKTRREVIGLGGEANGAVLWLDLHLDAVARYEARPGKPAWALGVVFFPFAAPIEAREGQAFTLAAKHDREHVRLWLETT